MRSPEIVLTASSSAASEWRHSIWRQMLASATIPARYGYNREFYGADRNPYQWSLRVPLYYKMLGKRLFGEGIKYPLWRFAGWPDRFMRKPLYLDFTGYKRSQKLMSASVNEIIPGFKSVREHGQNMIDASQLTYLTAKAGAASAGVS